MRFSNAFSVSATIAGAFIGAGFVSGQEMWQFFGHFGIWGVIGLLVAVSGLALLSFLILRHAVRTGKDSFHTLVSPCRSRFIEGFLVVLETVFYFSIYVIMTAGAHSLLSERFGINAVVSALIFTAAVTFISLAGVKGIMTVFSAVVPILTVFVLIISVISVIKNGVSLPESSTKTLFPALFSSLVYISYNFIAGIGVFASLGRILKNTRSLAFSAVLGGTSLFILGGAILFGMFSSVGSSLSALPMVSVANGAAPFLAILYSLLLIIAMTGASVSALFPIAQMMRKKRGRQITVCVFLSLLSVTLSMFGFSELISTVYPIFGYIGFIVIAFVIFNSFRKKER